MAINGVIAFQTKGDHFTGMNIREAHEHVNTVLQAIEQAQGFQDAMAGLIKTPTDCPRCKARNVTPRHVCKRGTPRTGR